MCRFSALPKAYCTVSIIQHRMRISAPLPSSPSSAVFPVHITPTSQVGVEAVTFIAELSAAAIRENGVFTVALSGGSMPKLLSSGFTQYLELHPGGLDFSKWRVFFSDERCVPLDHPDSTYKACYDEIFSKVPAWVG